MLFRPITLTKDEDILRTEVREFLREELPVQREVALSGGFAHNPEFSLLLASKGWVGMAIPEKFGGHGRKAVDRFLVVEELLAAGAPIGAHWIADRQTGQMLLHYGTEEQRERFLPEIAAGRCWFSIGMSEPDAGSDLASVRTRADRVDGGWLLTGTKVWTSAAHLNHFSIVLCRTSVGEDDRHNGLSQMIVDLKSEGLEINPIPFLDGSHHFNEVVFNEVFVPDEMVVGEIGHGWKQVTSELAFERAGPDRYMSIYQLLEQAVALVPDLIERIAPEFGRLVAKFSTLRQMSLNVSAAIDAGQSPAVQAALVKDLGTTFEQEVVTVLRRVVDEPLTVDQTRDLFLSTLAHSTLTAPSFTVRGGTSEVLRSIVSKGLS